MFIINHQSNIPIFEQLKNQVLEFISIGVLQPDEQLPSVRSLASSLGINPNTVSKAYQDLEASGYIYSKKGRGCFISKQHTAELINQQKLIIFENTVVEMQRHNISKVDLISIINRLYKEDNKWFLLHI